MKKLNYYGKEINVSDKLFNTLLELSKKEKLSNRRETRRHEEFLEYKHGIKSDYEDILFNELEIKRVMNKLNNILMVIRRRDRELFKQHHIQKVSVKDIAEMQGVTPRAIRKKLCRIIKRINELWRK